MVESAIETQVYILVLFYALIAVSMAGIYFRNRLSREVKEIYTQKLCECLQPQDHLPSLVFPDIEYSFNRRILIRLLVDLTVMLEGVEGRILLLIFHDNGLYGHILSECRYNNDHRKIRAMSVFQDIPIPDEVMNELERFLNSRNNELRMISLLVWLNQKPEEMMERLTRYPHELSDRDCANIYALAQRRYVPAMEAVKLLSSSNPTVSRFGKRVLKLKGLI